MRVLLTGGAGFIAGAWAGRAALAAPSRAAPVLSRLPAWLPALGTRCVDSVSDTSSPYA